jgi:hypothetical protein
VAGAVAHETWNGGVWLVELKIRMGESCRGRHKEVGHLLIVDHKALRGVLLRRHQRSYALVFVISGWNNYEATGRKRPEANAQRLGNSNVPGQNGSLHTRRMSYWNMGRLQELFDGRLSSFRKAG